ncbi:hypothetical protein J5TS2_40360 [Brevibacillus halotolerans]|uniref:hypothetical protein n=1 Tax=Brevibacillus halotolerans TaxID=1507437 RepID=UPI001B1FB219|nr:hypothetical protein [Brevibacillus halotolerans]GIO03368.1 hypothetical protein J5TS2_40360 [Brevibacillus halotolerans]
MYLLVGSKQSEEKLTVQEIYNLDHPDNTGITPDSFENSVIVSDLLVPSAEKQIGKREVHCINPQTKEQFWEYVDRPLTQDEEILQLKQDKQMLQLAITDLYEQLLALAQSNTGKDVE